MFKSPIDPEKFETLIEINNLINSGYSDVRLLLREILESATRLAGGEASSLLLVDEESNKLFFEIALGSKGPEMKQFSLNMGEGIAGWVAQHNTSLLVADVDKDPRFFSEISKKIRFPTNSILAVPMQIRGRCVGVIELINKKDGGSFTQEDLEWIEIFSTQAAITLQNARNYERAQNEIGRLRDQVAAVGGFHTFVGKSSKVIQEKLEILRRVAASDSTVLLLGESGVGKELFAEQIHLQSRRRDKPFIRVAIAALPESLLESELFGHVKGAFTDATGPRRGRFSLADGGTIFLDEIGELPLALQPKLLRVLQSQTFEKLGSSEPERVDVRIVAATNRDIEQAVAQGTFRSDLYYRLNVLPLGVPPLRQRTEDLEELAEFFLERFNRETNKQIQGFSDEAMEDMLSYSWPGNVRELENAIERAVVMAQEDYIGPDDLGLPSGRSGSSAAYAGKSLREATRVFRKRFLVNTLHRHRWNQTSAAKELEIQRTYLTKLIKDLEISK